MASIAHEARSLIFTVQNTLSSLSGTGIFPVDMEKVINKLNDWGSKRKQRSFDRSALAHLPVWVSDNHISDSFSHRAESQLKTSEHTITCLTVNTVLIDAFLKEKEIIVRSSTGITKGGFLTHAKVLAEYEETADKKKEESAKAARPASRLAAREQR